MPVPTSLKPVSKLLDKDEPKLLVLVGAGVSSGATGEPRASWLGLLKHGLRHLVETKVFTEAHVDRLNKDLDASFSPFNLEQALQHAETIEVVLATPNSAGFSDWLKDAFSTLKVKKDKGKTLEALRDLQQAGALLMTTNYDGLLTEVTGLPPVTWEEQDEFLEVMHRKREGILHVHGHWEKPSSVILGKASYNRIVANTHFQDAFRALWLEWPWIYVGCGDGLDDPNIGRLLEWGKQWKKGLHADYFLAIADKAEALELRPNKPGNLVCVGFSDYSELPGILCSLTPSNRCSHFVLVDAIFGQFRPGRAATNDPFPSMQEYLDGEVPKLKADAEVSQRLTAHGWAFVLDVASVGKTTLAMRLATSPEQRAYPVFYLNMANVRADEDGMEPIAEFRRLKRSNTLFIIDNVHHQPELVRNLWDEWRNNSRSSKLLLIGTITQLMTKTSPAQDLAFFAHHITNPAVEMRPEPGDLCNILYCIIKRVAGLEAARKFPIAPDSVLTTWHKNYGNSLGAFCLAVLGRMAEFRRGNWDLPLEAAAEWVRIKWLEELDKENSENLLCLSVFGAQEFELLLRNEALPYPGKVDRLLKLGLVERSYKGQFNQYKYFSLREPGWGNLILAAQEAPANREAILIDSAAKDPFTAVLLSHRLLRNNMDLYSRLWAKLAIVQDQIAQLSSDLPLSYFSAFVYHAKKSQKNQLVYKCWEAIESDTGKLAERAQETALGDLANFLETAKRHGRKTDALWDAIESDPEKLAERAWETSLGWVAVFLETAKDRGRIAAALWDAIESDPAKLAERAWETPLHLVAFFLETAKKHKRKTDALWDAIESDPAKLAERTWETPLHFVASFLETAKKHGRKTDAIWDAIESDPAKLAERAWETPLNDVGSFLETAAKHGRNTDALWDAIESDPAKLAERAWETPLGDVGSFLETAQKHGRKTDALWDAIESDSAKLAERAWETPLDHVGSFLETAKRHGRKTDALWDAIESDPVKLAIAIKQTEMNNLSGFFHNAPSNVIKAALLDIEPEYWLSLSTSSSLCGATWVAADCGAAEREDHKNALIVVLLQRAEPQDFEPQAGGFPNAAWLLANVPPSAQTLVHRFLDALCTKKWLGRQFNKAPFGTLAKGLLLLALNQHPRVVSRFFNSGLGIRLERELARFSELTGEDKSRIIQLFGCAKLSGWYLKEEWLKNVEWTELAKLPVEVLPHRPEATKVEPFQFQLWLGLYAATSLTKKPLAVPTEIINQTLEFWRVNQAENPQDQSPALKKVNADMVAWLEKCVHDAPGFLLPDP